MSNTAATPALSVIIAAPDDFQTVRQLVRYLAQQTIRDQIELVLVTSERSKMTLAAELLAHFWGHQVVEIGPFRSVNHARSAGIKMALAPVIVLTEDHCFPTPTWAEALLKAHQQPWAGVGPTFSLMNLHSHRGWAMFFIQYAPWMKPTPGGLVADIAGHNSSYKKDVLLQYGDRLEAMMDFEYALHQDLLGRGYQIYLESQAETAHVFMTDQRSCLEENFTIGRLLAATRARTLPGWKKIVYLVTTPLVPPLRLYRILKQIYKFGWQNKLLPGILPWLLWYLCVGAWGEFIGYVAGIGSAQQRTLDFDFRRQRFVSDKEKQRIWGEVLVDLKTLPSEPQIH
jgi:hypothetical protein